MRSAYIQNNYGFLFEALVKVYKPRLIVECGILDGFSLFALARAAGSYEPYGQVVGIDLFEEYPFNRADYNIITNGVKENKLTNIALIKGDAIIKADEFVNDSVDMLHVDIANTYDRLKGCIKAWLPKLKKDSLFLFEGGSEERDHIEWMEKYGHSKDNGIRKLFADKEFTDIFEFVTMTPFSALTICRKK